VNEITFEQHTPFNQIWHIALAPGQYWTIVAFSLITAASLIGFFCWGLAQQKRVDPRYSMAIRAGLTLTAVASLSYLLILYKLLTAYTLANGLYSPNAHSGLLDVPARYIDWSISVPLLVMELVGVSALGLLKAQRLRLLGALSGFLMILSGYFGEVATPNGLGGRVGWGVVSSVFFVIVYGVIIYAVRKSSPELTADENRIYRRATGVLMAVWFVYPIIYGLNGFLSGGAWSTTANIAYCLADITAKVGFGVMVFKLARMRSERSKAEV
jgi:bacteriorhodopsin